MTGKERPIPECFREGYQAPGRRVDDAADIGATATDGQIVVIDPAAENFFDGAKLTLEMRVAVDNALQLGFGEH